MFVKNARMRAVGFQVLLRIGLRVLAIYVGRWGCYIMFKKAPEGETSVKLVMRNVSHMLSESYHSHSCIIVR